MHLQNINTNPKNEPTDFLDNKWIIHFSYTIASIFIIAMLLSTISKLKIPSLGEIIILIIPIGYLYTDLKIRKGRKK